MLNKIICFIAGHKPHKLNCLGYLNSMHFRDQIDGKLLIKLHICQRCDAAFFERLPEDKP